MAFKFVLSTESANHHQFNLFSLIHQVLTKARVRATAVGMNMACVASA